MPEVHERRRGRLAEQLAAADVAALLVTRLVNVHYLTGFTGSHGAVLVAGDAAVLATDGRYRTQAGAEAPDVDLVVQRDVAAALLGVAAGRGLRPLGFEAHDVSVDTFAGWRRTTDLPDGDLRPTTQLVERLRAVKDDTEIAALREACAISTRALRGLLDGVVPGRTERSLARELESRMLDHGADRPAFATIVAGGPNSAVPHHRPTDRPLERGDLLTIDFGAAYGGYHADCTRTFVVGAPPQPWQREVYDLVREAQRAGREALRPGADVRDVDGAARRVVEAAGHGAHFVHGTGHGVGLEIHEAPLIGYAATGRLADRMPVTVEPGVYLEGRGGVRIEDTLVVRAPYDGTGGRDGPELLTTTTKDLLVLG